MSFDEFVHQRAAASLNALLAQFAESARRELDALRVALDVRFEALAVALGGSAEQVDPEALSALVTDLSRAASDQAQAAADAARAQALEEARAQIQAALADARAQIDAAQATASAARVQALAEAQAQVEAAQEAAKAARVQALAEAQAQVEAAQAAAKTGRAQAFEEAQSQIQAAHVEAQAQVEAAQAAAKAGRAQAFEEAQSQIQATHVEAQAQIDSAQAAAKTAVAQALEEARSQIEAARTDAHVRIAAAQAEAREEIEAARAAATTARAHEPDEARAAAAGAAPLDRLLDAFRAIDRGTSLTDVLNALVEHIAAEFPRAALFVVRGDHLAGWRSIGFEGPAADVKTFEIPLTIVSPLTRAVTTGAMVVTGGGADESSSLAFGGNVRCAVALPIIVGDRAVAVAYADDAPRSGEERAESMRAPNPRAAEILALHAARCLGVVAASARPAVAAPFAPAPAAPARRPVPVSAGGRHEEPKRVEEARRYARLLVSEIKLYNEAKVLEGRRRKDLYERLKADIERCRRMYAERVAPEVRATSNFFDEELVRILADGDASVLGRIA